MAENIRLVVADGIARVTLARPEARNAFNAETIDQLHAAFSRITAADIVLRRRAAPGATALTPKELENRAEAWRPWRSYAVMHLWRAAGDEPARTDARTRQRNFETAASRETPIEGPAP